MNLTGLSPLFNAISADQQKNAQREIARYLRRSMVRRLRHQQDVNQKSFTPRIRRDENRKMLQGFSRPNRLLTRYNSAGFELGYAGTFGKRARIHNLGLHDRIKNRFGKMTDAKYAAREWIGVSDDDIAAIQLILARYMSPN